MPANSRHFIVCFCFCICSTADVVPIGEDEFVDVETVDFGSNNDVRGGIRESVPEFPNWYGCVLLCDCFLKSWCNELFTCIYLLCCRTVSSSQEASDVSVREPPVRGFWREHDPVDPSVAFGHEDIDETEYVL